MLKITAAKLFTAKINNSQMLQLSRQNMSRQILVRNFFEPQYLSFAKKTGPRQIRTQTLWRPRRIRYHQAKCAKGTTKFEFIMNQGTTTSPMSPVDKEVNKKKRLVPDCNTRAYRKGDVFLNFAVSL